MCVSALYAKNSAHISSHCSIQMGKPAEVAMPIQITLNVWIITTSPSTPQYTLTQICPGTPTRLISIRIPIHTLELPATCSITSPYFYLPLAYHNLHWAMNVSLFSANLHMINILSLDFHVQHHLEDHHNDIELQHLTTIPSIPVSKLYLHLQQLPPNHPFCHNRWSNRWYKLYLDLILSHWNICYSYRITYTSRIGNFLLLLLLVLTCQISVLIFTTR